GEMVSSDLDWFARRDGSLFAVSYVSVPIEMPEGRGAVVAFADAGERVRGERLRHEHEAILAAQRRVAILVAGGAASAEVFAAIAREVAEVVGLPLVVVWRYEHGRAVTGVGAWGERPHPFQPGSHWPLDGPSICARVLQTGRAARIDDFGGIPGTIARAARETGICACAGAPIIVDGEVWGAMSANSTDGEPLPGHIEERLAEFTSLVATAISNTASRDELARLADEQASLRRVATLVARGVPPPEVFAAVAREVGLLFGVEWTSMARYEPDGMATGVAGWNRAGDPIPVGSLVSLEGDNVAGLVLQTGQPARMDGYEDASGPSAAVARERGFRWSVGAPIVVDQRLWGVMIASSKGDRRPPADAEARLAAFTDLVATAISNAEARSQTGRLTGEQAALRRVATLIAQGAPPTVLFGAVTEEAGRLIGADLAGMLRYETDATVTPVATWAAVGEHPEVPDRWETEQGDPAEQLAAVRRPVRIDDWTGVPGPIAAFVRELGIRSSVGSPIVVDGFLWGALAVHMHDAGRLPADTESRLENFTDLVATAVSNVEARAEVHRLADEQAALRRVATLVARESPPGEVFAAVAEEVERLLRVEVATMFRNESDGTVTVVAERGTRDDLMLVGRRMSLEGENVTGLVLRSGQPVRFGDYGAATGPLANYARNLGVRSAVGCPIVVGGRLWGAMVAGTRREEPVPVGLESRIQEFTELVAAAISNIQARSELAASRARIVAAADDERRRVVRDLHDGAQQRLVHTVVTLKLARRALEHEEESAPALVSEALDQAARATEELRELAPGILPSILTRGGLRAGVDALASRMPVPVEIDVVVGPLPAAVE
ncbi:MAG: hypothetical protein QOK24_2661, partial [Verrucomicrobiota bacterium]